MNTLFYLRSIGITIYLAMAAQISGQVVNSSQPAQQALLLSSAQQVSQNQATLQAYQTEQRALMQERRALMTGGATKEQLQAWFQQNSARIAAQQQQAQAMAENSVPKTKSPTRQPNIPANASQTLKDFLTTRAALANARVKIHNQLMQQAFASGPSLTSAQLSQIEKTENQLFQRENGAQLALQAQRSQALATESMQVLRPVPSQPVISASATPQMVAYLTARYQLRKESIQFRNQYANSTPAEKTAALQQWKQQDVALVRQLQQQAQNLAQTNTTVQK